MSGTFGTGGDEPYSGMLGEEPGGGLVLRRIDSADGEIIIDAARWLGDASVADDSALDGALGPLLDIGCGPGRMVRAAAQNAVAALGIDVSREAVALTSSDGTPALRRSVFDRLPLEGGWGTVLLMDGNVGIGGDPTALLRRCGQLLSDDGSIVVELDPEADLLETAVYTAIDEGGRESGPFPWARVGHRAVSGVAAASGLEITDEWETSGRYFARARRRAAETAETADAASVTTMIDATADQTPMRESA